MIDYSPKSWTSVSFAWRGTVLSRLAPRVAGYGLLASGITAASVYGAPLPEFGPLAHSLMGVALGMLLVFRTNASYDRYWEGRKRWGGVVNASRNLMRRAAAFAGHADGLGPLVGAYSFALKQHLRRNTDLAEVADTGGEPLAAAALEFTNPPARVALDMSRWIAARVTAGELSDELARTLEENVGELLDHQGACERILKTPVPFAYVAQIRQLLMVYLLTLPLVLVPAMEWAAIPALMLISFGLLGIEEAGVEIEDPFGLDSNDLPLDDLCVSIAKDARELEQAARL
jgi:ion channel-forming bestrophin family protein